MRLNAFGSDGHGRLASGIRLQKAVTFVPKMYSGAVRLSMNGNPGRIVHDIISWSCKLLALFAPILQH